MVSGKFPNGWNLQRVEWSHGLTITKEKTGVGMKMQQTSNLEEKKRKEKNNIVGFQDLISMKEVLYSFVGNEKDLQECPMSFLKTHKIS